MTTNVDAVALVALFGAGESNRVDLLANDRFGDRGWAPGSVEEQLVELLAQLALPAAAASP